MTEHHNTTPPDADHDTSPTTSAMAQPQAATQPMVGLCGRCTQGSYHHESQCVERVTR